MTTDTADTEDTALPATIDWIVATLQKYEPKIRIQVLDMLRNVASVTLSGGIPPPPGVARVFSEARARVLSELK